MEKNSKNEVLLRECDWKENLPKSEQRELMAHVKKIDGVYEELDVYNCDARIFYAGPEGIEKWLGNECAFSKLQDPSTLYDKEGEPMADVNAYYYYPEVNEMWAELQYHDGKVEFIPYDELVRRWEENNEEF